MKGEFQIRPALAQGDKDKLFVSLLLQPRSEATGVFRNGTQTRQRHQPSATAEVFSRLTNDPAIAAHVRPLHVERGGNDDDSGVDAWVRVIRRSITQRVNSLDEYRVLRRIPEPVKQQRRGEIDSVLLRDLPEHRSIEAFERDVVGPEGGALKQRRFFLSLGERAGVRASV